jgi:hypothetical protein
MHKYTINSMTKYKVMSYDALCFVLNNLTYSYLDDFFFELFKKIKFQNMTHIVSELSNPSCIIQWWLAAWEKAYYSLNISEAQNDRVNIA